MAVVKIPSGWAASTGGQAQLDLDGPTVGAVLDRLASDHPDMHRRLYAVGGKRLGSWVNVFVGETNIRDLEHLETPLGPGDDVLVLPAVAGG
ncbi:MoaD/ThiS family protein [Streptomyces sp. NPDC049577]|uniref:MoaD/ThiS family protein n=1 Tax=Streptomyces sp. NPDC049577 TaxID=3155153 RepID=UPI00342E9B1A